MKPEEEFEFEDEAVFDEEVDELSRTPRWVKVLLSVFLVALMVLSVLAYSGASQFFVGRVASDVLNQAVLSTDSYQVVFTEEALQAVQSSYRSFPEVETALCLSGDVNGTTYTVSDVYEPEVYEQTYRSVTHEACPEGTTVLFHTHPEDRCLASRQDQATLSARQAKYPETRMLIMCEDDRFLLL